MTILFETIRVALGGLLSNKLRSALTMIGITIGVAAVIALLSLGQALQAFVRDQFSRAGSNLITILAVSDQDGRYDALTMAEVEALSDPLNAPGIRNVMPQVSASVTAVYEGAETDVTLNGVSEAYLEVRNRSIDSGRFFTEAEVDARARVAVIGPTTADTLFPDSSPIGASIRIGTIRVRVVGVLASQSSGGLGSSDDDLVLIPVTTAQSRVSGERTLSGAYTLSNIVVQAESADNMDTVIATINRVLRDVREVEAGEADNFRAISLTQILDSLNSTLGLLTAFLAVIAGISLLVGGIGVMNIMLVTVTERTREIGLRKAVGAHQRDIVFQFLMEAITLSLVGGGLGILIAFALASLAQTLIPTLPVTVQWTSIALAVIISSAIGVFFGIYPARRAAALNPIDALRYE